MKCFYRIDSAESVKVHTLFGVIGEYKDSVKKNMNADVLWDDQVSTTGGQRNPINSIAYSPNGETIVVAVSCRVLVYDAFSGELRHSVK